MAERLKCKQEYNGIIDDYVIDMYYKSAPLHDIGKIGIRDEILLKPGKLTDDEFEEMKAHTTIGYNALSVPSQKLGENSFLKCAMEFAKYHHEKWDGTGYPEGLREDEIPLSGRIMAIADVYDALISKRVYKPAYSHEEAVKIMKKERGRHFDPKLLDVFMEIHDEFLKISREYADTNKSEDSNEMIIMTK